MIYQLTDSDGENICLIQSDKPIDFVERLLTIMVDNAETEDEFFEWLEEYKLEIVFPNEIHLKNYRL